MATHFDYQITKGCVRNVMHNVYSFVLYKSEDMTLPHNQSLNSMQCYSRLPLWLEIDRPQPPKTAREPWNFSHATTSFHPAASATWGVS